MKDNFYNDLRDDIVDNQFEEINQNTKKFKNQQQNRISSIHDKSNNKEELEENRVKFQEDIVKSKKS